MGSFDPRSRDRRTSATFPAIISPLGYPNHHLQGYPPVLLFGQDAQWTRLSIVVP